MLHGHAPCLAGHDVDAFGRPVGMAVFQRMIEIAKAAEDVWVGTRSEAVKHILARYKSVQHRLQQCT